MVAFFSRVLFISPLVTFHVVLGVVILLVLSTRSLLANARLPGQITKPFGLKSTSRIAEDEDCPSHASADPPGTLGRSYSRKFARILRQKRPSIGKSGGLVDASMSCDVSCPNAKSTCCRISTKSSFPESSPRALQVALNRRIQGRRTFTEAADGRSSRFRARGGDATTPAIVSSRRTRNLSDKIEDMIGHTRSSPGGLANTVSITQDDKRFNG